MSLPVPVPVSWLGLMVDPFVLLPVLLPFPSLPQILSCAGSISLIAYLTPAYSFYTLRLLLRLVISDSD
jgi:hypothetical protein